MNSANNFVFTEKSVGIGTTNPSYKLHVKGNGQILSIDGDQNGHCYHGFLIGGSRKAYLGFPGNGSEILTIANEYSNNRINIIGNLGISGNIGIGTTDPSYKLHVKGNGQVLSIDGDQNGHCYQAFLIGGSRKAYLGFPGNGSEILTIKNEYSNNRIKIVGNLGIGTSSPSQKLDVNGNINFSGDLYKNGSVLTLSNYSDSSTLVNDTTFVSNLYDKLHDNEINIYDTIKNGCSTVSFAIRGSNYTCSGSFITFDSTDLQYGLFMTAAHCVMDVVGTTVLTTTELYVTNPITGNYTKVDVNNIYYDGVADVAIIRTNIDFSSNSSYPLQLSSVTPQTGDICFLCGNPGGLDNISLSQGFIRDARFYENGGYQVPESLYIDTPGIGGNSGSPILNKNGKIIGIFTFGSSATGRETFGGGSNLTVLNKTLPVLKTQAISGSSNKRNTDKYYIGLDYWTPRNAPFTWKSYYGNSTTFPNQGVRIYAVTSGISPFRNVLGYLDILLSATINGTEYQFGELSDQYPPGMLLYQDNASIQIKYLDYSDSNTEKTASITLVTYGDIGNSYAYLDAPLSSGSDGSDNRSNEITKNVDFAKNM